jgi:hypothetical protein
VSESGRAGAVICFVLAAIGCILKWRVVACPASMIGGDHAGVALCGMVLCANGTGWLLGLAKFGMLAIYLAVVVLGGRVPGKVFVNMVDMVADHE